MSGARRYWKETVGVLPGSRAPAAPRREAPSSSAIPETTARADSTHDPRTRLADPAVERILDGLPVGSLLFGNEVASSLWRTPSAEDLARLATLAGQRPRLTSSALRDAIGSAVTIRLRFERLSSCKTPMQLDPNAFSEQSAEYERLARMVDEVRDRLVRGEAARCEAPEAIRAARQLMPEPGLLMALAAHAAELGAITDLAIQGRAAQCWRPIPEATGLLTAIEVGRVSPDQHACLQIYGACLLALRDLEMRSGSELLVARGLLDHITRVTGAPAVAALPGVMPAQRATPHKAAWRRLLQDARSRIDERLTRPARARDALSTLPRKLSPSTTIDSDPQSPADRALLAHMKAVRARHRDARPLAERSRRVEGARGAPSTKPRANGGGDRSRYIP